MKSFFGLFADSFRELTGKNKTRCIAVTAMLIAVSMAIEGFTIEIPFAKINFAFIAIAAIGMLFGPFVSFIAGGLCDVVGYLAHPDGAFIPAYIVIAMIQGLIYGMVLYTGERSLEAAPEKKSSPIKYIAAVIPLILGIGADAADHFINKSEKLIPIFTFLGLVAGLIILISVLRSSEQKHATAEMTVRIIVSRLLDVLIVNLILNTYTNMYFGFIPQQAMGVAIKARLIKNLAQLCADIPLLLVFMPLVLTIYKRAGGRRPSAAK